jgi:hypothetical protein
MNPCELGSGAAQVGQVMINPPGGEAAGEPSS